jgi:hypothetical protein
MSSHIRMIVQAGGGFFRGPDAKKIVERYAAAPVKTLLDMQGQVEKHGLRLWIFREPRKTRYSKSRYKRICALLNLRKRPKPQGVNNGRANPIPRPPGAQPDPGQWIAPEAQEVIRGVQAVYARYVRHPQ